jgi:hypothetical protein
LNIKVDFLFVICKCRLLSVESYKYVFFTTNCSMHVYTRSLYTAKEFSFRLELR